MTEPPTTLAEQIAALEAALKLPLPDDMRRQLLAKLHVLQTTAVHTGDAVAGDKVGGDKVAGDKIVDPHGSVIVSDDARINGVAVGINLGRIIYGRNPEEDDRRWLVWYLARLASKLYRLPLRGLEERLDQGEGLALSQVYVMLATERYADLAYDGEYPFQNYFQDNDVQKPLKPEYDPDWALPVAAIFRRPFAGTPRAEPAAAQTVLSQAVLVTEAVGRHQQLVLLGAPGSGKSTFLRHFAWSLAQRGLDQLRDETALQGWDDARRMLPIIVPLRMLAGKLAAQGVRETTVYAVLREAMQSYCVQQVDNLLSEALHHGAALLLLDGLDEVPIAGMPGVTADRATTVAAVRAFAQLYPQVPIVLTCRIRAFDERLRAVLGWHVETIAPFTLGQVRHFVAAWYADLVAKRQLKHSQANRLGQGLIGTILTSPKLQAMAGTPLLLTMMALVLYNKGELPRDRPQLYERILELLLGQWDKMHEGQSLAEAIGVPDWGSDRLRPLLDQLSYQAHIDVTSEDGRGRLAISALRDALIVFFETARLPEPWGVAHRCLDYIEQRSGLLMPDATDSYVFAHLTLQEHCAGRHIALNSDDPVALVMQHRTEDCWQEPILLGMGLVHPAVLNSLLTDLIDGEEDGLPKAQDRWYRDLIMAAEIGADRNWNYLRTRPMVKVDRLQRDLKRGLVALLADPTQPLPAAERVRAGFLLGNLGDPRFPVTIEGWRHELARAQAGDTSSYFCRVEAGTYMIGAVDDDPAAKDDEPPLHMVTFDTPFLIARYPITNAQWQAWVQAGGEQSDYTDASNLNHPSQAATGVTWDMCNAFCAWLGEHLGVTARLPTEEEWEAAARGGDSRRYPWGDEWQADHAATGENEETRVRQWSVPVGCYPAGAAPCGALDMAGNVWEWTASWWQFYAGAQKSFADDQYRVLRGGGYGNSRSSVHSGARGKYHPNNWNYNVGFRLVVASRSH